MPTGFQGSQRTEPNPGLGPSEGILKVDEIMGTSFRKLDESLKVAKQNMTSMIPDLSKLESATETLEQLGISQGTIENIRIAFESNEAALNGNDQNLKDKKVYQTLKEFHEALWKLNDRFRRLVENGTPGTLQGKKDEVASRLELLEVLVRRLEAWENRDANGPQTPTGRQSVRKYTRRFGQYVGEHISAISQSMVQFSNSECQRVFRDQERQRDALSSLSTVATIISAVTAAILPAALDLENPTRIQKAVDAMWFFSLTFSLAATVNGLLDLFRRFYENRIGYPAKDSKIFSCIIQWMTIVPRLFLLLSIVTFQVGLCLLAYASHQPFATSGITTFFSALSLTVPVSFALWFTYNALWGKGAQPTDNASPSLRSPPTAGAATLGKQVPMPKKVSLSPFWWKSGHPARGMDVEMGKNGSAEMTKYQRDPVHPLHSSPDTPASPLQPSSIYWTRFDYPMVIKPQSKKPVPYRDINQSEIPMLTYPLLSLRKVHLGKRGLGLELVDMSFSADGRYIGAVTSSGDCRVYNGVVEYVDESQDSKYLEVGDYDDAEHSDSDDSDSSDGVDPTEQPRNGSKNMNKAPEHIEELRPIVAFRGFEFVRISWFKDTKFALLVARHSTQSHRFVVADVLSGYQTLGPEVKHVCYTMLRNTNAFISVDASLRGTQTSRFVLNMINSEGKKKNIRIDSSDLLELNTPPMRIKTIALTKDDRYLIYTEDSVLSDPSEMWISVIDLRSKDKLFEIPILREVTNVSTSRYENVALIESVGIAPGLWKLHLDDDDVNAKGKDLLESDQAYSSPKITDMSGESIFCGAEDEWVVHWNSSGVVSWWDRHQGTLVQGPIEFQGLRCLSASADSKGVRLAVGRKYGRIELWSGKHAAVNKVFHSDGRERKTRSRSKPPRDST